MENKIKIKISAFKALDNLSLCEEFMEGHANVLRDIGINVSKLTSANSVWSTSPESTIILARSLENGQLLGGVRVDIGGRSLSLPIEEAIGNLDNRIYEIVKLHASNGGTCELCGLWISSKAGGMGVAALLLKAGISITNCLEINSMQGLCSEATLSMLLKMGYIINTSIGNNGTFYYPKEDLLATALIIPNLVTLEKADKINRDHILNLRLNPKQKCIIIGPKGEMEIDYDLEI